ncbi:MAG: alpha/beta hydrolase [Gluconacetobacter diazotrophicus]|nr:alpha/beta hydrolase [Gluconacetobacter diazotrophicus]
MRRPFPPVFPALPLVLALAACSAAPRALPPSVASSAGAPTAAAPSRPDPHARDRRLVPADTSFAMPDGAMLPARTWRAAGPPRAVILALHGFDDSRDAWEIPAPALAARGFTTYAPDQRGFGGAPDRGRWPGTDRLVSDAFALARQVHSREPGVPLFLMGESMGGGVLMCLLASPLMERPDAPPVAGSILLAPAVWSEGEMNPALTASLWLAATLAPDWHLTGRELPLHVSASDNRAALFRLAYDPLTLHATRAATLSGLVSLMTRAQAAAPFLRGPVLYLTGGRDQLVPPAATAAAWQRSPPNVRRAFYPAGYHLLPRDKDRDAVLDDIASWMLAPGRPLPSGADPAAAAWLSGRSWEGRVPVWLPGSLDSVADTTAPRD